MHQKLLTQNLLGLFAFLSAACAFAQTATLRGTVVDETLFPLEETLIRVNQDSIYSDRNGDFSLTVPANKTLIINVKRQGHSSFDKELTLSPDEEYELIVKLQSRITEEVINFQTVEIRGNRNEQQSIELEPRDLQALPSLSGGIADILKTLPNVNNYNELSSQYAVRGGNYDENLIYINGIEMYRPQMIRAGEQEGLSIVNPYMTQAVNFSAGGWEAKYGDKMSSVLDITYARPTKFMGVAEASLFGGNLTFGGATKNRNISAIVGARYLNRNLVLNTLDGETEFNPQYIDFQTSINVRLSRRLTLNALGMVSQNDFDQEPQTRETTFGALENPLRLNVFYDGQEDDAFYSENASLNFNYRLSSNVNLSLGAFGYHTTEREHFTIASAYLISEVDPATGGNIGTNEIGGQIDHARNDLDILVAGVQHRGKWNIDQNSDFEWGLKFQQEDVRDRLNEYQLVDSTGFSIPGGLIPGNINPDGLQVNYALNSQAEINSNRYSAFAQYTKKFKWNRSKVLFSGGVRATYWDYNGDLNLSPRAQIAVQPDWREKHNFRLAAGLYYQPPFYREIRDLQGNLNDNVVAQRSIHMIAGHDWEFEWMDRPFKLTSEVYYKILSDLNPYFVDNVRIRYRADNNAKGRAYGVDMRLFGEFVPGVDSWFSISYARAEQNIDDRGFIPLPTDPRFKTAVFFQDYLPFLPTFKANVTMIYASGLPNGAPPRTDPYDFQNYLNDYFRADVGFLKEFINEKDLKAKGKVWKAFKELSLGLNIFNVFDRRNEISNLYVVDVTSNPQQVFAVPNRLTGRFINFRILARF